MGFGLGRLLFPDIIHVCYFIRFLVLLVFLFVLVLLGRLVALVIHALLFLVLFRALAISWLLCHGKYEGVS